MKVLDDAVRAFWGDTRRSGLGLEFLAWGTLELGEWRPALTLYQESCAVGEITLGFDCAVAPAWRRLLAGCLSEKIQKETAALQIATGVHEIRNPLAVLSGYIEILQAQNDDPVLNKMEELVMRIVNGLEDLLTGYTRACSPEIFDITSLCHEVASEYQLLLRTRRIHWTVSGDPVLVEANRRQMRQVMRNLLQNAADAVEDPGHIAVETAVRGAHAVIAVSDDGPGITEELWNDLFEPYYTSKPAGHGLGLALCKRIIEIHGGSITVENLKPGSRFTAVLPLRNAGPMGS